MTDTALAAAQSTTARLGLGWHVAERWTVGAEVEQDIEGAERKRAALGADYQINDRTKLYGRFERQTGLGSLYGQTTDAIAYDASSGGIHGLPLDARQTEEVLLTAAQSIFAIADDKVRDGFVSLRHLAQSSFDTIEKLHARKELVTGVPTGFTDLDEMTSGLQAGDLVIVAARPSMGKTSLVMNMAQHVGTKTDMTVGVFSLEMSKEQLFLRLLTSEARIDAHRLRGGFLGEKDWGRLAQAIGTLSEAKIFIDDTPSIGVLEMRAKCRRLAAEHGLHMVVIDYVQLMQGRGRFENRSLELASISRSLKGLAKELRVPIIVLSQLSRASETRSDHRPQLSDLRESGALEQDADVVMFIYREDMYMDKGAPPDEQTGVAEIIIGKQRNGPIGVVKLAFLREFTRFENLAPSQG